MAPSAEAAATEFECSAAAIGVLVRSTPQDNLDKLPQKDDAQHAHETKQYSSTAVQQYMLIMSH
jgi:hypothetical protein